MWNLKEHGYKPEYDDPHDTSLALWLAAWLMLPGILLCELLKWIWGYKK